MVTRAFSFEALFVEKGRTLWRQVVMSVLFALPERVRSLLELSLLSPMGADVDRNPTRKLLVSVGEVTDLGWALLPSFSQ